MLLGEIAVKKRVKISIIIFILFGIVVSSYIAPKLQLFSENKVSKNFRNMDKIFPSREVKKGQNVYKYDIELVDIENTELFDFLDRTNTTGFLVIKNNKIVFEKYYSGYDKSSIVTSFSVAKSFISTLVGIAYEEGLIKNLEEPIINYLPELKKSGFERASISDVLQMSSGINFTEGSYGNETDARKVFYKMFINQSSLDNLISTYGSMFESGKEFYYSSINTHALAMLVKKVTNMEITSYLEQKIWIPLGMENDAYWTLDNHGNEIGFMGLNATLRDFSKLGMLFLNKGNFNNNQVLSADWIDKAVNPDKEFLQPGNIDNNWGYQYQWWIPKGNNGDFSAIGIWGQFIYVNPKENVVIVKTSSDKNYMEHEFESIEIFRDLASIL